MSFLSVVPSIIGGLGSFFGGLFKAREKKAEVIQNSVLAAVEAFKGMEASEAERAMAIALAVQADLNSNTFLSGWRQLVMTGIFVLIAASFFGYVPPNMPDFMMTELFELLKIGIMGYVPARTIDKALGSYQGRKLTEAIVNKVLDKL